MLQFTPKTGICAIVAISKQVDTAANGQQLKSAVDDMADQLKQGYGNHSTKGDMLTAGSIWREPGEWTTALAKKERFYQYFWMTEGKKKLKNNVESIGLKARSSSTYSGSFIVKYEFINFDECTKIIETKDAGAL
ncbi:hypothetical protein [Methylobacterium sp. WL19]|uniref:hypothetical protein n=1 Tax=Methylobacterium sp. WL19 TaxID=2603896 RepID=UPI0011CA0E57|nr:hypothetical protein [Methylobacterium sp. WL19]TXN26868.1 hypothetical protein FV220_13595 [Methylobacterium sp. WL19]